MMHKCHPLGLTKYQFSCDRKRAALPRRIQKCTDSRAIATPTAIWGITRPPQSKRSHGQRWRPCSSLWAVHAGPPCRLTCLCYRSVFVVSPTLQQHERAGDGVMQIPDRLIYWVWSLLRLHAAKSWAPEVSLQWGRGYIRWHLTLAPVPRCPSPHPIVTPKDLHFNYVADSFIQSDVHFWESCSNWRLRAFLSRSMIKPLCWCLDINW